MESTTRVPRISTLWIAAGAVAAIATWICYDAIPGINWLLWTLAATTGLMLFVRPDARSVSGLMAGLAVLTAGGAAFSANQVVYVLILFSVILLLALAMLLAAGPSLARLTTGFAIAAPIIAITNAFISALSRAVEATQMVRSPRARSAVRGIAITLPILIVFALLLAVADPDICTLAQQHP